jgi:hypothetical protein
MQSRRCRRSSRVRPRPVRGDSSSIPPAVPQCHPMQHNYSKPSRDGAGSTAAAPLLPQQYYLGESPGGTNSSSISCCMPDWSPIWPLSWQRPCIVSSVSRCFGPSRRRLPSNASTSAASASSLQLSPSPSKPRRGRLSHSHATLYILYGESRIKCTGWCQNDFNVQDYQSPSAGRGSPERRLKRAWLDRRGQGFAAARHTRFAGVAPPYEIDPCGGTAARGSPI